MNICMMTNTYLPHVGGVAKSVSTFTEDYRRHGHHTLVVAPIYAMADGEDPPPEPGVVRLPAIQQFNGSDFSVRLPMTAMMNPELMDFVPDIVHSHHPFLIGDTALRYAADHLAPVVFTHHTLYEEYTHYVSFSSPVFKHFVVELSTHYANLCDAVIAPSQSIAELIRQRGVKVPIAVIPTGIDVKVFSAGNRAVFRRAEGIPEEAFLVGHVGRLAPEKNLGFLARAAARFLRERKDAYFLVVGTGRSTAEVRAAFARAGVEDRLRLAGTQTGSSLHNAYAAMDVFAFSSFSETQGMVLAEALAAGVPVVALDASGVREVVQDGKNGFLLPAGAGEEVFAAHLERFAAERGLLEAMKVEAQRTAQAFSREASAAKALRLYQRVVRRARRVREDAWGDPWAALLNRIRLEWNLWSEKAEAAMSAWLSENGKESGGDESDRTH